MKESTKPATAEVKVGADPTTPPDDKHAATHPLTSPDAPAPLLAEELPVPADAYAQDPPPAREPGPAEATAPPYVVVSPTPAALTHDARGYPVAPVEAVEDDEAKSNTSPKKTG